MQEPTQYDAVLGSPHRKPIEPTEPTEIPLIGKSVEVWEQITYQEVLSGHYRITTPDGKTLNYQQALAVLLMECWYLNNDKFFETPLGQYLLKPIARKIRFSKVDDLITGCRLDGILEGEIEPTAEEKEQLQNDLEAGLENWFYSDFTLVGYAGTGKTASLQALISRLKQHSHLYITVTAPTNKALKVIKQFGKSSKITGIEYQTIYQALGLKLEVNDDGKEEAVGDSDGKQNLCDFDLFVCDEGSMVPNVIYTRVNGLNNRPKGIWMGDSKQLKPVGDKAISPVFTNVLASYTLDIVMRYPEGSAIANLVTAVRDNVGSSAWIDPNEYADNDKVIVVSNEDFLDRLIEDLKSDRYQDNPDSVKAICYTNKVVDWINNYCHEKLYGTKSDAFVPGERLVSTKPVTRWSPANGTEVILKNRFEVDVLAVAPDEIEGYKAWQVRASVVDEDRRVRLMIVDPSERKRLASELDDLRQMALKLPKGSFERKAAWKEMYKLRNSFDSVVHSYSGTGHSSQGSSYNHVYIAERDLMRARDHLERSQLKYVAYSRAMEKLIISL